MPTLTAALMYEADSQSTALAKSLTAHDAVTQLALINPKTIEPASLSARISRKARVVRSDLFSGVAINQLLNSITTEYLLLLLPAGHITIDQPAIDRLLSFAEHSRGAFIYSDFIDDLGGSLSDHPLIDYQIGSIRDSFDFGGMILISKRAAGAALRNYCPADDQLRWAGLYDLRLKLSIDSTPQRVREQLYTRSPIDLRASGDRQFDYVDPRQRDYQVEMEAVATNHLKRIGAYLEPEFQAIPKSEQSFPVLASVVIPVRNRERTIKDAVTSALSQRAPFGFNVIVVDNHSTDRTTEILDDIAANDMRLIHLIPSRTDLGIGGCWNEAIYSAFCGQYAVQLDSDDIYADER